LRVALVAVPLALVVVPMERKAAEESGPASPGVPELTPQDYRDYRP
jgi:hypothetical protein